MRLKWLFFAAVILAAFPATSRAIEIAEARWGFDGRATPQCFNLLSVLVINPGSEPFEGTIELRESIGGATQVGAPLAEDVYVAPSSSRWVQFYPYVKESYEEWTLHWGRRPAERADVPRPRLAAQMPVLLVDADDVSRAGATIRQFPENLFPPMVTATDALKAVALDHVPRWEESRRQAFHDWLSRGGRLHLFKDVNGSYPQFSAGLADLNAPGEQFRIGSGDVFRHDRVRSRIDAEFMKTTFGPKSDAHDASADPDDEQDDSQFPRKGASARRFNAAAAPADALFPDLTGGLFAFLKGLTRPTFNWTLIYSMAAVYVLTVVPGVHFLGRKRFDYRLVYGVLIGLIVLFSLGFASFGRRGHNEANAVNTLAVARQLPGGAFDVTGWTSVFVINGADYEIVHGGSGRLYSTAQAFEPVNGVIRNGARGRFDVDIPPFSTQPFLHRMKVKSDGLAVRVGEFSNDKKVVRLALSVDENFPQPAGDESVFALDRDQVHFLKRSKGRLEWERARSESLAQYLSRVEWNDLSPYSMRYTNVPGRNVPTVAAPPFERLLRPFVAWSLHLARQSDIAKFSLPDDRLRLFVWSELPEAMKLEGAHANRETGRVLYVVDIPKPVKP